MDQLDHFYRRVLELPEDKEAQQDFARALNEQGLGWESMSVFRVGPWRVESNIAGFDISNPTPVKVALSLDGRWLAKACPVETVSGRPVQDTCRIIVWDLDAEASLWNAEPILTSVGQLSLSTDASELLVRPSERWWDQDPGPIPPIQRFGLPSGKSLGPLGPDLPGALAVVHITGNRAVTLHADGQARIWMDGKLLRTVCHHEGWSDLPAEQIRTFGTGSRKPCAVAALDDGFITLLGGVPELKLWTADGELRGELKRSDFGSSSAFGQRVVFEGEDFQDSEFPASPSGVAVSPDGTRIAVAYEDCTILLFSPTGEETARAPGEDHEGVFLNGDAVTQLAFGFGELHCAQEAYSRIHSLNHETLAYKAESRMWTDTLAAAGSRIWWGGDVVVRSTGIVEHQFQGDVTCSVGIDKDATFVFAAESNQVYRVALESLDLAFHMKGWTLIDPRARFALIDPEPPDASFEEKLFTAMFAQSPLDPERLGPDVTYDSEPIAFPALSRRSVLSTTGDLIAVPVHGMMIEPDVSDAPAAIFVFETSDGTERAKLRCERPIRREVFAGTFETLEQIRFLSFNQDDSQLVVLGEDRLNHWDLDSGEHHHCPAPSLSGPKILQILAVGDRVAVLCSDKDTEIVWLDLRDGSIQSQIPSQEPLYEIAWRDGHLYGRSRIGWRSLTGEPDTPPPDLALDFQVPRESDFALKAMAVAPESCTLIAAFTDGSVLVFKKRH